MIYLNLKTLSKLTPNELVVDEVLAFGRKKHGDPKFFVAGNEDRDFQGQFVEIRTSHERKKHRDLSLSSIPSFSYAMI